MDKAFLFDMDGVLIDTEREWAASQASLENIFGKDIVGKMGDMVGLTIKTEYEKAVGMGFALSYEEYVKRYDQEAVRVFEKARVTEGVNELGEKLLELDFKLAIVSSSRRAWINFLLPKLSFGDKFDQIISLDDYPELKPKPAPDGYLEALKSLRIDPKRSIILEDSNRGIQSAKAAGAYVVGFKGNLGEDYRQEGADVYANTMAEVATIVESLRL